MTLPKPSCPACGAPPGTSPGPAEAPRLALTTGSAASARHRWETPPVAIVSRLSEQEYDAFRAAENLAELTCPELQGPEWHLDRNGQYPGYQRAEREPAARYLQEDGSDD